jgi:hypothetical protein
VLSQQYLLGRISGRGSFPPLPSLTEASAWKQMWCYLRVASP